MSTSCYPTYMSPSCYLTYNWGVKLNKIYWANHKFCFLTSFSQLICKLCYKNTNLTMQMLKKCLTQCLESVGLKICMWNASAAQILFIAQMLQKGQSLGLCCSIWNENEYHMKTWVYLKVSGISTRCFALPLVLAVEEVYKVHLGEINVNVFNNMFPFQFWLFFRVQDIVLSSFFSVYLTNVSYK